MVHYGGVLVIAVVVSQMVGSIASESTMKDKAKRQSCEFDFSDAHKHFECYLSIKKLDYGTLLMLAVTSVLTMSSLGGSNNLFHGSGTISYHRTDDENAEPYTTPVPHFTTTFAAPTSYTEEHPSSYTTAAPHYQTESYVDPSCNDVETCFTTAAPCYTTGSNKPQTPE